MGTKPTFYLFDEQFLKFIQIKICISEKKKKIDDLKFYYTFMNSFYLLINNKYKMNVWTFYEFYEILI